MYVEHRKAEFPKVSWVCLCFESSRSTFSHWLVHNKMMLFYCTDTKVIIWFRFCFKFTTQIYFLNSLYSLHSSHFSCVSKLQQGSVQLQLWCWARPAWCVCVCLHQRNNVNVYHPHSLFKCKTMILFKCLHTSVQSCCRSCLWMPECVCVLRRLFASVFLQAYCKCVCFYVRLCVHFCMLWCTCVCLLFEMRQ